MDQPTPPRGIRRGTVLAGRYLVEERLGAGGMGTVYRGRQLGLERDVAIKLIGHGRGATETQMARFEREARLLARLSHPAVVTVHDFGRDDDDHLFLVLELVKGEDLATRLRREGPLPWPAVARLGATVAEALHYAHEQDVLHRDLKPSNLMLVEQDPARVKVIDFGLARLHTVAAHEGLTESAYVVGTPGYIAPEYAWAGTIGPPGDAYALGVTLCEALSGHHPFESSSGRPSRLTEVRDDLRALPGDVPPALVDLLVALLDPDPEARPRAAHAELDRLVRGAGPSSSPADPRPASDRRRAATVDDAAGRRARRGSAEGSRPAVEVPGGVVRLALAGGRLVEVRVPPFRIDKHLVTAGDYLRFVRATGAAPPTSWTAGAPARADLALPVVGVSFDDAAAYAAWEGRRLPTEAEWELAARGPEGRMFPWGDRWASGLSHPSWREPLDERVPGPIGVFSPQGDSPFGVSDLLQLWEWVTAPYQHDGHLVRGGPWRDRQQPATLDNRSWEDEPARDVGFRCAG